MNIKDIGCVGVDWIKLAKDRIQGRFVNKIINVVVQERARNFLMSLRLSVSEGPRFMELMY
jgi:hypothetical protein